MIGKPWIQAVVQEHFDGLIAHFDLEIVVEVFDVFVVRYVLAHCRIARFRQVLLIARIFFRCDAAINGLLYDFPTQVMVGYLPLQERSRR